MSDDLISRLVDNAHETADMLESMANMDLLKAQAYHNGYVQAREDFGREMRKAIEVEQG